MSETSLRFSRYLLGDEDPSSWQLGADVAVDPYDGFFDQALEGLSVGATVRVFLDDGRLGSPESNDGPGSASFRVRLGAMPFVVCHYLGKERFRVVERATVDDALRAFFAVAADGLGERIEARRRAVDGVPDQRASIGADDLPTLATVERALAAGCAFETPIVVAGGRRSTASAGASATGPIVVERSAEVGQPSLDVIVIGSNDIDGCRVYRIGSAAAYERGLRAALAASGPETAALWAHLLD